MKDTTLRSSSEPLRFFATAALGLVVDLSVAWGLISILGWADIAAAGGGLACGMLVNYFLHLNWTFAESQRTASFGHFMRFSLAVATTLVARAGVLHSIDVLGLKELLAAPVRLGLGAAASFALSYLINRHLVFNRLRPEKFPS